MSTLDGLLGSAQLTGSEAALEHLSRAMRDGIDASYLRRQYEERGSSEGMVDAAIARFRASA